MYGTFAAPTGGGGGVLPVCGEVAGFAGRHRRPAGAVEQSMVEPSSTCVAGLMYGLFEKIELGRPGDGLTTHWIQFEAFSASAHEPCTYQLALSPRSRLKRVNTSFISISERKVPYLMYAPSPPDSTGGDPVAVPWASGTRSPAALKVLLLKAQA